MFRKLVATAATLLIAASLSIVGVAGAASALGQPGTSDGPTPYTVGATGITLPNGATFQDNQSLGIHSTPRGTDVHFEAKCVTRTDAECAGDLHVFAQYIGASFIPWSVFHLSGSFCVTWVSVSGYNEHFGEGGQAAVCSTSADATAAAPTIVAATCTTAQTLSLGAVSNASWGAVTGGTGPSSYSVTATADGGHTFSGGSTTATFTGELTGPLPASDPACQVQPVCIPSSAVSYSYNPSTNSGVITVGNVANSTGVLCKPFWVTATSWLYTKDASWPQARDVVQKLPKISTPGVYPFAAAVTCGQGDIYASFDSQPEPTAVLNGPGTPFAEHFLHDMGFNGPTPSYMQQATSCNVVTPVEPSAKAITSCDSYGSVTVPADTAAVTYTVTGSGNEGDYTVTATVNKPYTLKAGVPTSWTFHLGQYSPCETRAPAASYTLGSCYPNGGFSSKNLYFVFNNEASNVPVTFTVTNTSISEVVAAHSSKTVEGTPIWQYGTDAYDVYADGTFLTHLTIPAFTGCLTTTPGDPSVSPAVCTEGVIGNGSLTVDLKSSLIYTITGVDNPTNISPVTSAVTSLPAGSYTVSVVAAPGYVLDGADNWPLTEVVAAADGCDLPTFADQPTNATVTDAVCGTGNGEGSITVGQVDGVDFSTAVDYFIDGVPVTQATTALAPGTYSVTAAPRGTDTLDGPSSWSLTVHAASTACAELTTLALTGSNEFGWIVIAIILLQLGFGVLAVRAVLLRRRGTEHQAG